MLNELLINNPDKSKEIIKTVDEFINSLQNIYPEVYNILASDLNALLKNLWTEAEVSEATSKMINKDGTVGPHWTIVETDNLMGEYNRYDFYYVLNMIYNDFYKPERTLEEYVELAKQWLDDPDVPYNKAKNYYEKIVLGN